jgi:cytidylate kinase
LLFLQKIDVNMELDPKIIIAVDGYAACGKSTLAKALAKKLGYIYIDSGAMYRAVTLYFLKNNIGLDDKTAIAEALKQIHIDFKNIKGQNHTFLNGKDVETEIREMFVSNFVSPVSTISAVRRFLVARQKEMGNQKGIVMDGRDIGTVVFPDAELKLFMTASIQIRTERRLAELKSKGIIEFEFEDVQKNLLERDRIDSTREDSPLKQAEDAIIIDNSNLNTEEQLELALRLTDDMISKKKTSYEQTA